MSAHWKIEGLCTRVGNPDDWLLPRIQLSQIAFRRLSIRLESVRQSEQGISIAKTITFPLNSKLSGIPTPFSALLLSQLMRRTLPVSMAAFSRLTPSIFLNTESMSSSTSMLFGSR